MSGFPEGKKPTTSTVRIPNGLKLAIDDFLKTNKAKKRGFRHVSDVVAAAVREILEKYQFFDDYQA